MRPMDLNPGKYVTIGRYPTYTTAVGKNFLLVCKVAFWTPSSIDHQHAIQPKGIVDINPPPVHSKPHSM